MKAGVALFFLSWLAFAISGLIALTGLGLAVLMWLTGRFLYRDPRTQAPGDDGFSRWYKVVTTEPSD